MDTFVAYPNNLDFNQTFIVEKLGLTEYSAKNSEKKLF